MLNAKRNRAPRYLLGELFLEAGIVAPGVLESCLSISKKTRMQIGRTLVISGHVSELDVECAVEAQDLMRQGTIDVQLAKELLRFAHVHQVTIDEAYRMNGISRELGALSRLGKLVLAANVVTEEQLRKAMRYAEQTGYPLGQSLVHLNMLSERTLSDCINLQILMRDGYLHFLDAVKALTYIEREGETFEHLLEALGLTTSKQSPRVGELLEDAKLITHEDRMVLAELGTEKDMQYGELIAAFKLVPHNVVDAAIQLQKMFTNPMFTKERAIRILHLVKSMDTTIEHVMVEFDVIEQAVTLLRAANVIDEAVLRETAVSIQNFEMSVAEALIMRKAITADQARKALMCLHQIESGTMTYEEALACLADKPAYLQPSLAIVA